MSLASKDKGGNRLVIAQLNSTLAIVGATLVSGTNCLDVGNISESSIQQQTNKEEYRSEDGVVRVTDYEYSIPTTGTLMETDKTKIDFLAKTVKNKRYLQYKYQGIKGGNHQEVWAIVEVTPQFALTTPGGITSMPYESTGIYPRASVTYSSTVLLRIPAAITGLTIRHTGSVTIGKDDGYLITQKAV